jgi:hypothetical protein
MAIYSVFISDYLVVDADNEEAAKQEASEWLRELLEKGDITWDVEEGDASEGMEDEDEDDVAEE